MIARCARCLRYTHPPLPRCVNCGSDEIAPQPVSGRGRIKSFSVNHQRWVPGLAVPYVVAVVELVEQERLYLFTNIVNRAPETVATGMPVKVVFLREGDVHLPMFEPDEPAS